MGSICGWSGTGLGSDVSQQTIEAMLEKSGGIANTDPESNYDDSGALGIREGINPTSFHCQDRH